MHNIGDIVFSKSTIRCITGSCVKNEPIQIIRIRENKLLDVVNLRNELIFKIPFSMVSTKQQFP